MMPNRKERRAAELVEAQSETLKLLAQRKRTYEERVILNRAARQIAGF